MPQTPSSRRCSFSLLASAGVATVLAITTPGKADISSALWASDNFIVINASSTSGSGSIYVPLSAAGTANLGDQYYIYYDAVNTPIGSIATLVQLDVVAGLVQQPDGNYRWGIGMTFVVQAGSADTSFELLSPVLGFSTLTGITNATTSGTLGGTDQNASSITITPTGAGGTWGMGSFLNANSLPNNFNNVNGVIGGSSLYRHYFHNAFSVPGGLSEGQAGNMSDPLAGNPNLTGIYTIQTVFSFKLSANDQAGGTSDFSVPAPAAATMLGLGGLLAARRRR